jgi:multicomponent Na+:H+ antiporter subunit A
MGRESLILSISARTVFPVAVLFSVFLLFAGHNAPGGGFIGGLVAGAALVLRYVDRGPHEVARVLRLAPPVLLGVGLAVASLTGIAGLLDGGQVLEAAKLEVDLPILGTVKTTSALPFDIGVYLVVVGLVALALQALGGEEDDE